MAVENVVLSSDVHSSAKGLLTYEQLAILDGNRVDEDSSIERAYYYDYMGRVIQTVEKNHLGGISRYSTKYDFVGNILAAHESHQIDATITSDVKITEFTYDHRGRLLSEKTTLNDDEPAIVQYGYDELGKLASKTYGTGANAVTETYDYNIQGWLTSKTSDVFDMELRYYDPQKPSTEASYTGNITEWEWRHKDTDAGNAPNTYAFTYDKLSRLTDSQLYEGAALVNTFAERGISYDMNGNILSMKRYQGNASMPDEDMEFTAYDGNRLTTMENNGVPYGYEYDANGNMTSDGYNALKLKYNYLNLTAVASDMSDNVQATYSWLADGAKLGVKNAAGTSGYEYLGSLVYKYVGGELQLESTSFGGGRIIASESASGTIYTPNYYITDHLGSIRVIVSHCIDVLDRNDYYPYGLKWEHSRVRASSNRWLYNGKELQITVLPVGSNYLDYGARIYSPKFGRWLSIDSFAEMNRHISPFAFCSNNPVNRIDFDGNIDWPLKGNRVVNKADYIDGALGLSNTVVRTSLFREERKIGTSPHIGIDYRASIGDPIYSLGDGKVSSIETMSNEIQYITIEYGNGDKVRFLHMNSISSDMEVGRTVYEGQVIGEAGNSGRYKTKEGTYVNYQPHLHIDAKDSNGNVINPEQNKYGTVNNKQFFEDMDGDFLKLRQEREKSIQAINEARKEYNF